MPKQLLESDYLTVDLNAISNKQKTGDASGSGVGSKDLQQEDRAELSQITDWAQERKKRQVANVKQAPELRKDKSEVDMEFFNDYFENAYEEWDAVCAKQLISIGEPLKKIFIVLGFDKNTNPILAFLLDDYVINSLLKTKLLNINTFKAIYNAVVKELVTYSELSTSNDYNIIYCQDLYKRSASEMISYLELQSEILEQGTSENIKKKNVFTFINDSSIHEKNINKYAEEVKARMATAQPGTVKKGVLNKLELAKQIHHMLDSTESLDTSAQQKLSSKLNTPAQILAAIQFLSITTNNAKAKQALTNTKFSNVSTADLLKATSQIINIMPKGALDTKEVDAFVDSLLSKV